MKKITTKEFIEKANRIHGSKYDYSVLNYISSRFNVDIICPIHGQFKQNASSHLMGKGCKKCGLNELDTNSFIEQSKKIHQNKYDYKFVDYVNATKKVVIVCPIHGQFKQKASSHLAGFGCSKCSYEIMAKNNTLTTPEFINQSKEVHGDKYDYTLAHYVNNTTKVKIICPKHGIFEQTPHSHKRGQGCRKCANQIISKSAIDNSRGWSLTDWIKKSNAIKFSIPRLYAIKCYNQQEEFIKIGITMREINVRFKNNKLMPYNFEILLDLKLSAEEVFNEEIRLKKLFKKHKYIPKIKFSGDKECFDISIIDNLLKIKSDENLNK